MAADCCTLQHVWLVDSPLIIPCCLFFEQILSVGHAAGAFVHAFGLFAAGAPQPSPVDAGFSSSLPAPWADGGLGQLDFTPAPLPEGVTQPPELPSIHVSSHLTAGFGAGVPPHLGLVGGCSCNRSCIPEAAVVPSANKPCGVFFCHTCMRLALHTRAHT